MQQKDAFAPLTGFVLKELAQFVNHNQKTTGARLFDSDLKCVGQVPIRAYWSPYVHFGPVGSLPSQGVYDRAYPPRNS